MRIKIDAQIYHNRQHLLLFFANNQNEKKREQATALASSVQNYRN